MRFTPVIFRQYGNIIAIAANDKDHWVCQCGWCGGIKSLTRHNLIFGATKSCGCIRTEKSIRLHTTHGLYHLYRSENNIWKSMKRRCHSPLDKAYTRYGATGIKVCDRWRTSFENFFADMGPRPSPKHSLDRINNNGNYEPGNVKWATVIEQANNRRMGLNYRIVTLNGIPQLLADVARDNGIKVRIFRQRLRDGKSIEEAVAMGPSENYRKRGPTGPRNKKNKKKSDHNQMRQESSIPSPFVPKEGVSGQFKPGDVIRVGPGSESSVWVKNIPLVVLGYRFPNAAHVLGLNGEDPTTSDEWINHI